MIDALVAADVAVFRLLNTPWPGGDTAMWWVSLTRTWIPLQAVLVWKVWQWAGGQGRRFAGAMLAVAVCIGTTDAVSSRILKPGVERLRPTHDPALAGTVHAVVPPGGTTPYLGGQYGFVSSHAANTAGVAVLVGSWLGAAWLWPLLAVSLLIGYSRIYLGVHFPLDVLCGMGLGAATGAAISYLHARIGAVQSGRRP
jgi:undecaprenyl-diphosphatase